MAGRGRSVESWNALAPSTRRRWIAAFGGPDQALEAYRNGASLTATQRGHAYTPERPINALFQPWKYPRYVATHTTQLNQLARQRGLAERGTGPRGETPETQSYTKSGGDFTYVNPRGTLTSPNWRFSTVVRTEEEAQLYARRSWAPAGVVQIEDNRWERDKDQPPPTIDVWRYEVWFGYPEKERMKKKKKARSR
jgi:hypothetical protein